MLPHAGQAAVHMQHPTENRIFGRLAVVAGCLSLSSVATWGVALAFDSRPWHFPVVDGIVPTCYFSGMMVALVILIGEKGRKHAGRSVFMAAGCIGLFVLLLLLLLMGGHPVSPAEALEWFGVPALSMSLIVATLHQASSAWNQFPERFPCVFRMSLPVLVIWIATALAGYRILKWCDAPFYFADDLHFLRLPKEVIEGVQTWLLANPPGEIAWLQIALVLLAACLTFCTWHRLWNVPERIPGNGLSGDVSELIDPGAEHTGRRPDGN